MKLRSIDIKVIPHSLMIKAAIGLFVLTIISRLVDQGSVTATPPEPPK